LCLDLIGERSTSAGVVRHGGCARKGCVAMGR
jgi:hypothetical protein